MRRAAVGVLAAAGLLTAGCTAGQQAQTASEKPTLDGVQSSVGSLLLRGLAVQAPVGSHYYQTTSNALVTVVIANSGSKADTLTGVSSPAFGGWSVYPLSAVKALQPGGLPQLQPGTAGSTATAVPGGRKSVPIGAGASASFGVPSATGALVLTNAKKTSYPGSTIPITFTFADAGSKTVQVPIQITARPQESIVPGPSATGQLG
jgi:copper(I)-binding protein